MSLMCWWYLTNAQDVRKCSIYKGFRPETAMNADMKRAGFPVSVTPLYVYYALL